MLVVSISADHISVVETFTSLAFQFLSCNSAVFMVWLRLYKEHVVEKHHVFT